MSFYIFLIGYWIIYIKDDDRQMWFYIPLLSIDMYLDIKQLSLKIHFMQFSLEEEPEDSRTFV